jgi:hypothetical protein
VLLFRPATFIAKRNQRIEISRIENNTNGNHNQTHTKQLLELEYSIIGIDTVIAHNRILLAKIIYADIFGEDSERLKRI